MLFEFDATPWLELAQNWVFRFLHFLKEGAEYSTGYDMLRFIGLPVVWLLFAANFLHQASTLHKHKGLASPPPHPPYLSFCSGVLWLIPVWVPYAWTRPDHGLYLVPFLLLMTHVVLWYSGMFRHHLSSRHVYSAGALMVLASYLTMGQLSAPYKQGLPQKHLVQHTLDSELLAQMMMHRCFEAEGCLKTPDLAARVTIRHLRNAITPLAIELTANRCAAVGHSPLGLMSCIHGEDISLRSLLVKAFPSLPSAAADCHPVAWQHTSWQPNGFWPTNPPLSILSAREEVLLNCAANTGYGNAPFLEGARPNKSGRYELPAINVIHHDWYALKIMWAEDVVNAPGAQ